MDMYIDLYIHTNIIEINVTQSYTDTMKQHPQHFELYKQLAIIGD